jgi:hypothetical protein
MYRIPEAADKRWAVNIRQTIIVLVITFVVSGCIESAPHQIAVTTQAVNDEREATLVDGYFGSDIRIAEKSLLALVDYYSTLHVDGIRGTLGLTHARLFLLYAQLEDTSNANRHREQALVNYRGGIAQTDEERWSELLDAVRRLDGYREVRWRTRR